MSVSSEFGGPGRQTRRAVLPDLAGLHLRDARIVLKSAGFDSIKVHYVEDYLEDFKVVRQKPRAGNLIDRHREVVLYVSRQNFVTYMPTAFQQIGRPGSFLHGFLYIIQTLFDRVQGRLDTIHEVFDPRATDPAFLPWLASWLAVSLNAEWSELKARKMLLAATRLFPYRGTSLAIKEFVRIYTDANVEIEENTWPFKGFRIEVNSTVGVDTVILPTMNLAHCFVVRLDRPAAKVPEDEIIRIHQIIQTQKPAHAAYFLAFSDEEEAGEMGIFMEIGTGGAIGVGGPGGMGMGIGVGAVEAVPVAEPAPEPDRKPTERRKPEREREPGSERMRTKKRAKEPEPEKKPDTGEKSERTKGKKKADETDKPSAAEAKSGPADRKAKSKTRKSKSRKKKKAKKSDS